MNEFAIDFATPRYLIWLWLVPVVALLLIWAERRRRPRVVAFVGAKAAASQILRGRTVLKVLLRLTALAATIVALAGPRWGFAWQNVKRQGADIMLAVDVSRSMLAGDIDPDRLTRARRELVDFLQILQGDRVGLAAFAGEAFVQCPLTEDYGAARMFIDLLQPDLIPVQGTDIGRALDVALKGLEDGSPGNSAGRAIVLITDGEDLEGSASAALERVKAAGVKLYTIGVGSEGGAPIPEPGGGFKKDATGALVMTKPDEATLQSMALATGGMYVRSVAGDMDLQRLYDEGIRAGAGQKEIASGREKLWFERYQWFLVLAFFALVVDFLLSDVRPLVRKAVMPRSRRDRGASVGPAVMFLIAAAAGAPIDAHANPRAAFEAGDYATAASEYQAAEIDDPDEPRHSYNRALSQFKAGQYAEAVQGFERAANAAAEPRLKQDAWFNLGNARVGAGKLPEAKAAYEQALALDPSDRSARENLEYVKKLMEEQQKQDEKKDEQQDQKQDQQDQQQENQDQQKQQDEQQKQQDQQNQQKQEEQQSDQPQPQDEQQQNGGEQDNQDQQSDQKSAEQQQEEQKQEQQAKEQQAQEQKESEQQPQQGQARAARESKDMDKQEAERLLQGVEDQATKYHYRPEGERGANPRQPDKDW